MLDHAQDDGGCTGGVLLLYHLPTGTPTASTISEHINSFVRYSRFPVFACNTELICPRRLAGHRFAAILFHYSLRPPEPNYGHGAPYDRDLASYQQLLHNNRDAYKVAFFQDEYIFVRERVHLLNHYDVDCVFTLLEPSQAERVYRPRSRVRTIVSNLPGYVSEELRDNAIRFALPDELRSIDVGYRARDLPFYMGSGAQEKAGIGKRFVQAASRRGLRLDIRTDERDRLYGDDWPRFVGRCRAMLGVESGVSIFDFDGTIKAEHDRLLALNPRMTFAQMSEQLLHKYENNVYYRTCSPRNFEAAASLTLQIMYPGSYGGVLRPMEHYVPLEKDFANLDEVIRILVDPMERQRICERAHADLIASGRYDYARLVETLDQHLLNHGCRPLADPEQVAAIERDARSWLRWRTMRPHVVNFLLRLRYRGFPGRSTLKAVAMPVVERWRRWRATSTGPVARC